METPDQLAQRNAQKPKGVKKEQAVRRELCSIITKGTAFHRDEKSTYLLAVDEDIASRTLGVAFVDAATGHFHLGQVVDDEQHGCLRTLLAQLRPDEIVINEQSLSREAYTLLRRAVPDGLFNPLPRTAFWADKAACSKALEAGKYFDKAAIGAAAGAAAAADNDEEEDEAEVTGPEARWPRALRQAADRTPCLALSAFGGCATYLKRLLLDRQLLSMGHVSPWVPTDADADAIGAGARHKGGSASLVLDAKALENLEVFENSSDRTATGTLFSIIDKCSSSFGRRTLRAWLCAPPRRVEDILERQQAVDALLESAELRAKLAKTLKKLPDLERLLARVHAFSVTQTSNDATHYTDINRARLAELIKTLEGFEALHAGIEAAAAQHVSEALREGAPRLAQTLTTGDGFPDLRELLRHFREAFDWAKAKAEGRVIPSKGADDDYDAAKEALEEVEGEIEGILRQWQKHFGDKSIELWSAAGSPTEPFQLAVPETTLARHGTPAGFMQMSSKKGMLRFWTPELKAAVTRFLSAKDALDATLATSARRLYVRFSSHFAHWHRAVHAAAELDCLLSLSAVSGEPGMTRPVFVDDAPRPFLRIDQGVNICVRAALDGANCVPNDIRIGAAAAEAGDAAHAGASPLMLLVTGPNMGGKSTLLRQACLTVLLAHLGCHVPAAACNLTPVDRIFTRVGANDAIMAGLSTFRVELEETATILRHATEHSLVILDELGRGTATFDGMAIAHATLSHLITHVRCRSLFATHYHALTREFEAPNARVALYHMACAVDEASRAVTFLYSFAPGACHRSHGVNVARLAGLPEAVLELAASKSAELEALLEERYTVQLARRVLLAAADAGEGGTAGAFEALLQLWHEVKAGARS